jgi:hypothetical protein
VLELYLEAHPELLNIEARRTPVDADLLADAAGVVGGKRGCVRHRAILTASMQGVQ